MSDPRHNGSIYASSGRPHDQEDMSFLDFLRTAGGTVPADPRPQLQDRQNSAERKRRHTGAEHQGRNYPYATTTQNGTSDTQMGSLLGRSGQAGDSRATAIDLTSEPRSSRETAIDLTQTPNRSAQRPTSSQMSGTTRTYHPERRESDIALPRWQPDTEVDKCPVCSTDFSFWQRKHHCRKCGRVVCSKCSPHRITIPRQYIVQPPTPSTHYEDEASSTSPLGSRTNLGGGEIVRVCNPCVPDPWTPGPTSSVSAPVAPVPPPPPPRTSSRNHSSSAPDSRLYQDARYRRESEASDRDRPDRYRVPGNPRNRSQSHQVVPSTTRDPRLQPQGGMRVAARGTDSQEASYPRFASYGHRYSSSSGASPFPAYPSRPAPPVPASDPRLRPTDASQLGAPVRPREPPREVPEEDECPVCGEEMPPGESIRESHIDNCIKSRFSSTPSQSRPVPTANNPQTPAPTNLAGSHASTDAPVAEGSRPRATSYRPRGMAVYTATEKDCQDESGDAQECIICFNEFEPGDEMGRMECLCKFHRTCIRQWWDTKGTGSCPTHQLHD